MTKTATKRQHNRISDLSVKAGYGSYGAGIAVRSIVGMDLREVSAEQAETVIRELERQVASPA